MTTAIDLARTSGQSLAGFHGARSILYSAVWHIFSDRCGRDEASQLQALIAVGASALGQPEAWLRLRDAMADVGDGCSRAHQWLATQTCIESMPDKLLHRVTEFGLARPSNPIEEARLLGALAEAVAVALSRKDLARAAELGALQLEILQDHASPCIARCCDSLLAEDDRFLSTLSRALRWLVEHDLRLLDSGAHAALHQRGSTKKTGLDQPL